MDAKTIRRLVYYLACSVVSAVMTMSGCTISSWEFWVVLACVIVAHITGVGG